MNTFSVGDEQLRHDMTIAPRADTIEEVERLPGCSIKIADLFRQWHEKATLLEISAAASDSRLSALQLFHGIWGVGDATAREFYNKGTLADRGAEIIS